MFSAILALIVIPYMDLDKFKGYHFKPNSKIIFLIFMVNFLVLMQLGGKHVENPFILLGQISTVLYFGWYFFNTSFFSFFEYIFVIIMININNFIKFITNNYSFYQVRLFSTTKPKIMDQITASAVNNTLNRELRLYTPLLISSGYNNTFRYL